MALGQEKRKGAGRKRGHIPQFQKRRRLIGAAAAGHEVSISTGRKAKSFLIKMGSCSITKAQIVLTMEAQPVPAGKAAKSKGIDKSVRHALIVNAVIASVLTFLTLTMARNAHYPDAAVAGAIALFLWYGIFRSRNSSGVMKIDRDAIRKVKYTRGVPGFTRPRFIVAFRDEKGRTKERAILMPGSFSDGQREAAKALKIFKLEKLI
ncbi:MAG: hypothetical protein LBS85_06875 [Clostridiales Family XIII bacterium]|jgi:hypothetical protein|nr:hypothetical protein [Clostridiales Family XIII bacterium]